MSAAAQIAITLAGWTGAICAVVAYGLVTSKRVTPDSFTFQGLNLFGAGLLAVSATVYGAWPSAVVNVIWVGIGVFALRTLWRKHRAKASAAAVTEIVFDGAEQDIVSAQLAEEFLALDAGDLLTEEQADESTWNSAQRTPVTV